MSRLRPHGRLAACLICAVIIAGGATSSGLAAETGRASGAGGCLDHFAVTEALGTGRARGVAGRVLEEARRFPGDRYTGRLRWASAYAVVDAEAAAKDARVGRIRGGVVPVTGATQIRGLDPDYGYPLLEEWVLGGLRASDGRPLWGRAGDGMGAARGGDPADPASLSVAEDWWPVRDSHEAAGFDLATGRANWCRTWDRSQPAPSIFLGDGTGVATDRGSLVKVTLPEGREVWRTPSAADPGHPGTKTEYAQTRTAAGTVIAATGTGEFDTYPATTVSELAAFQLSDGRRRWRIVDRAPGPGPKTEGLPIRKILGAADGVVLVAEQRFEVPGSTRLAGYDLRDGRLRWVRSARFEDAEGRSILNIKIAGSRVLITEPGGRMRALRARDGSTQWSVTVAEVPDLTVGAVHGRHLYTVASRADGRADDARLVVLDLTTGTVTPILAALPSLRAPNDIAIGGGVFVVQFRNLTLAFDLP